jgi:prepilin-type N-terminal cleavage/methylation domain-containing protein
MPAQVFNCPHKSYCRAFTLIEMLIVASLLSVTGLAVYHAIANGMRVWEYSRRYSSQEDIAIFFEKITADLQNVYQSSLISFDGKAQNIFIPTIVRMPADQGSPDKGQMIEQMGAAEYYLQAGKRTIYRRQNNYSQALKNKKNIQARALSDSVTRLHFSYFVVEDGELKLKKKLSDEIPASVQIEIDFVEVGGNVRHLQRMINLPSGAKR